MDKHTQMTDYELELLINEVESAAMLEAPKRLKSEVMAKSHSIQTQTAIVTQAALEGMLPSTDTMERIETGWEESNVNKAMDWLEQLRENGMKWEGR